jgi:hypothetical protein
VSQNLGGPASDGIELKIGTMADFVSDKLKTTFGNLNSVNAVVPQLGSLGGDIGVAPINELAGNKIRLHSMIQMR